MIYFSNIKKQNYFKYKVGLCIQTGWICWINGPFPAGTYPDITIFRLGLKQLLLGNEMVEADGGYRGDEKVRHPGIGYNGDREEQQKQDARSRHETVNERMKNFACLNEGFRHYVALHDMTKHKICFEVCAIITQLHIATIEPLYGVDYNLS